LSSHKLDPLLRPESIAVVGASQRAGSVGNETLVNLLAGAFPGPIYPVNPSCREIGDLPCYPQLEDLPSVPQLVIFTVADSLLEALFDSALALGVKAFAIFSSLQLSGDNLAERIREKAEAAGVLLHGANCMGFHNFTDGVRVSGFDTRIHRAEGNVALISQSGAGMSGIMDCEARLDFNFAASTGQELIVSMEDYLDYVLDQPQTRVVGLFLETSRRPEKFVACLDKARSKKIPIVVLKVGRTALAAELAVSHSGALAGSDAAYQAVFDYYGVQRVEDMAQLATALIMFAQPYPLAEGGLVTLHDSGGERQLAIDMAEDLKVPLTHLQPSTRKALSEVLDPGLPVVNPLDAWGSGGAEAGQAMQDCFALLMQDTGAALGAVVHDRAPEGKVYSAYIDYLREANRATNKPVFLVANHQGTGSDEQVAAVTREGLPIIDGLREFLFGARALMAYRDYLCEGLTQLPVLNPEQVAHWRSELENTAGMSEAQAASLLYDMGIPMVRSSVVESRAELESVATDIKYPVVLKTAVRGIVHKSDVAGVMLGLDSSEALLGAYDDLAARLGSEALVAPMVEGEGQEMILGITTDEQFGPLVVMGIGGTYTEVHQDVVVMLPPFDAASACKALERLHMRPLLNEVRGRPALDVEAYCEAAARLSVLALALADAVKEIDINPVKLLPEGCLGLDALIVCHQDPV